MFLLSYTKSEEFQKEFQDCLLAGNFLHSQNRDIREYRDRIDPGAAAGQYLGHRTTRTLEELNGIGSEHGVDHWSLFKVLDLSSTDRREIGRAMVLADRRFGAIDEIAWNGFLDAFKDFASHRDYSFSVGREKKLSTAELRVFFESYFIPAGDSGYSMPSLRIKLRLKSNTVDLEFRTDALEGAAWVDRSFTVRPARNAALLKELNGVLENFRQRLEWMERYRASKPLPGISDELRYAVSQALRESYRCGYPNLDSLRPGIYFEDEDFGVKIDEGKRGFPGRCVACQQIVAFDVYRLPNYAYSQKVEWSSKDAVAHWDSDDRLDPLLQEAHRARGCKTRRYISSRNGKEMSLRSIR